MANKRRTLNLVRHIKDRRPDRCKEFKLRVSDFNFYVTFLFISDSSVITMVHKQNVTK